ncbi:MAG: glycosyl hydrolase family 18 protein [Chloroflexota bacterium]
MSISSGNNSVHELQHGQYEYLTEDYKSIDRNFFQSLSAEELELMTEDAVRGDEYWLPSFWWAKPNGKSPYITPRKRTAVERPVVFGYLPFWIDPGAYRDFDYGALSHIGYFSFDVDPKTGSFTSAHGWQTTEIVDYAHNLGVKVVLVATNFGANNNAAILSSESKQNTLITTLIYLVMQKNADGVNIDFEDVPSSQRLNLVTFMQNLVVRMREKIPNAEISMATPAIDWSGAWDLQALSEICDYLVLMGYDYSWAGSSNAGPVAPLDGGQYTVSASVQYYLNQGISPDKVVLGVPWYGYEWKVKDLNKYSPTLEPGRAIAYNQIRAAGRAHGRKFDNTAKSPWYVYKSDTSYYQGWYEDSVSLGYKYAMARDKGLGGIAIWALGYQGAGRELWNGIKAAFNPVNIWDSPIFTASKDRLIIEIYPNPNQGDFLINLSNYQTGFMPKSVRIYDLLGKLVYTDGWSFDRGDRQIVIQNAVPGTYILMIDNDCRMFNICK